ncbi:MAG: TetR/AcrR family transcriptional regulator [Dethiobacteria bacterium]|jgi:TetR/AcrR family fatty acid metabolism transcriptional regulator
METAKKADKKELIREAAIRVIAREGFYTTTTDRIAAEAGVAVGTVYNYFKNKEDILSYIFEVEYEKRAKFYKQLQERDALSALEKLYLILEKHLLEVQKNPDIGIIILSERRFPRQCQFIALDHKKGLPLFLSEIISEGREKGELHCGDPQKVSTIIFGALEAILASYLLKLEEGKEVGGQYLKDSLAELMRLVSSGIKTT